MLKTIDVGLMANRLPAHRGRLTDLKFTQLTP